MRRGRRDLGFRERLPDELRQQVEAVRQRRIVKAQCWVVGRALEASVCPGRLSLDFSPVVVLFL